MVRQVQRLGKLLEDRGVDLGDEDDEVEIGLAVDLVTGELVVAIVSDGFTYSERDGKLIVQHEGAGHVRVDAPGRRRRARRALKDSSPAASAGSGELSSLAAAAGNS